MYKKSRARYFFLMPGVAWILAFTFFPLIFSLYLSFTNANMRNFTQATWNLVGFQNYASIGSDLRVGETVVTSLYLTVGSTLLTLTLGTFLAWLFNHDLPGLRIFRSILTMPLFAAPIALGFMGLILFNETSGSINSIIRGLGGTGVRWMTDSWSARTAVLLLDTWQWSPFVFVIILAAMQSIPEELYEAARLDTGSGWAVFRSITFPLIAPALGTVALLRLVETFKILDIPFSMLGGGPGSATQTYSYYVYITGLRNFNMGYASALAYILVIIAIIISTVYFWRVRARFE
jgi:multiple sugar transport system permease protein